VASPVSEILAGAVVLLARELAGYLARRRRAAEPPPLPPAAAAEDAPPVSRDLRDTGQRLRVSLPDLAPRVLVVDDLPSVRTGVARLLSGSLGLRVDGAATVEEAQRLRREHDYAVVVWDVLPGMPRRERWLLYSARVEAAEIAREIGADRVVDKGEPEALERAVRDLLGAG
jgi:hypothetical protein